MLKKLLILSVLSFSVFSQAEQSLIKMIEKGATVQEIRSAIEQGADVNAKDKEGKTALMNFFKDDIEITKALLEAGANVNARDNYGRTVLVIVSQKYLFSKKLITIKLLVQYGADVSARGEKGRTALMYAAYYGLSEVVKLLLEAGADVNARDRSGDTALTYAYKDIRIFFIPIKKADYEATVQILREAGAVVGDYYK